MKPATPGEDERRRAEFCRLLRQSGLEFDGYILNLVWAGELAPTHKGYIQVQFTGDDLTFDVLDKASQLLGTRQIDISCDHGTGSDPCHERLITFWRAIGL